MLKFCCSCSLWVGWCLYKSRTLPLTLHKFIKAVSFLKFFRKTRRWAKSVPTAGENPLLITLRTKTQVMVPLWLKKFQNGPACFWDLFSSYLAQSSYLVWNSSFELGFLNIFSCQNLLRSLSFVLFMLQSYKYGAKNVQKTALNSTSEMIRL